MRVEQPWVKRARSIALAVRRRVLEHTIKNGGGYLSQACSAAEILATLYVRVMSLGPSVAPPLPRPFAGTPGPANANAFTGGGYNGPQSPELDRFVFSPVHYALVLYSTLIEVGRLAPEALNEFNQDGSTVELIGAEHSPGHEVTAGSLAQALSVATGIAMGRRLKGHTGRVWVFLSDGELQEGQTWEALSTLAYHRIDNVGIYIDANAQQCDGTMDSVMRIEPVRDRLEAFGALVHEVDGHDVQALAAPVQMPTTGKPLVVLARTDPCHGLPLLGARAQKLHYVRIADENQRQAYQRALDELSRCE